MSVDLDKLAKQVDEALAKETKESLTKWLNERRQNAETGKKQCNLPVVMRWLGFSGHKWKYDGVIRTCKKCGDVQRLIDYEAFCTIWCSI